MGMNDEQHETHDRLTNLQNQIKNMDGNVVLVGDIMLDRYIHGYANDLNSCLLYTSPSPRDKRQSRMPSSA